MRLGVGFVPGMGDMLVCDAEDRAAFAGCSGAVHQSSRKLVASLVALTAHDALTLRAALTGSEATVAKAHSGYTSSSSVLSSGPSVLSS